MGRDLAALIVQALHDLGGRGTVTQVQDQLRLHGHETDIQQIRGIMPYLRNTGRVRLDSRTGKGKGNPGLWVAVR